MSNELYNVLDKLREIAESGNDSEDVARAIKTVEANESAFMKKLKEAEDQSVYGQEDIDDFFGGPDETTVDKVKETPGDDDSYCAACGNTGEDLSLKGEPCPNGCGDECSDGEALDRIHDRVAARGGMDDLGDDPWGLGEDGDYRDEDDEIEEAVNPVDVKDAMKHLWELLNSGLDPETKQVVQQAYVELKQKVSKEGGQA